MILLEKVSKAFGHIQAVRDISLSVSGGEIFGLVGPNGAGKTTTIKMMTGLLRPDCGSISYSGIDIVKDPISAKASFGYVPDRSFLYDKLTAREFLAFVSSIYGLKKEAAFNRIEELLELFGIADAGDELIGSFSQGMRQRLLFSSALLHSPASLIIDEPFIGLDPFGVQTLKDLLLDLSRSGTGIFLATHSLHAAEEICCRIGFIKKGSLVAVRSRDEISRTEGGLTGFFFGMK